MHLAPGYPRPHLSFFFLSPFFFFFLLGVVPPALSSPSLSSQSPPLLPSPSCPPALPIFPSLSTPPQSFPVLPVLLALASSTSHPQFTLVPEWVSSVHTTQVCISQASQGEVWEGGAVGGGERLESERLTKGIMEWQVSSHCCFSAVQGCPSGLAAHT